MNNIFSNNLKKVRKQAGYTQKSIGELLDIETNTYTKYETGANEPPFTILVEISEILEVSLDYLILNEPKIENDYIYYLDNNLNKSNSLLSSFTNWYCNKILDDSYCKNTISPQNDNSENNEVTMCFAETLKKIRADWQITQQEMAEILGHKYNTYKQYESKRREPDIQTLVDIAATLNCTIDYLLKGIKRDSSKYIEYDKIINQLSLKTANKIKEIKQDILQAINTIENLK